MKAGVMKGISVLLLIAVFMTGCASVKTGTNETRYVDFAKKIDALYADAPASANAQQSHSYNAWTIGLSGMLSTMNGQNVTELNPSDVPWLRGAFATCLKRDWGITTTADLLSEISWCLNCGNSKQFDSINMLFASNPNLDYGYFVKQGFNVTEHQFNMVKYCSRFTKYRSLHAWDYGRAVWLVRTGFYLGLISESDAWAYLKIIGNKIDGEYSSWQDFGANYCIGRIYWAGLSQTGKTLGIYRKLVKQNGAWSAISWRNN